MEPTRIRTKFVTRSVDVPLRGPAVLTLYPSRLQRRVKLSSRRTVLREANRRGLLVGILSRASMPITPGEAFHAAIDSRHGLDRFGHSPVPIRWHEIFTREFIRSATSAAHTDRSVSTR